MPPRNIEQLSFSLWIDVPTTEVRPRTHLLDEEWPTTGDSPHKVTKSVRGRT